MDGASWVVPRADTTDMSGGGGGNGFNTNGTNNMLLNQFKLAAARSIRTSTIILCTFNTIAAFATAMGILYDSYSRAKRNNRQFKFSQNGFSFVPSGEVYPLVLSFAITIQGTTFAVAQSTGLKGIVIFGCTLVSQLMLPALFIVPYTQLVFAVELALRGMRKKPFAPRGKWTVTICLATIGLLTLANFLVADFIRTNDFCFGSLFWFVAKYSVGCFGILVAIASIILICFFTVAVKLYRSIKIEVTERVCASRMVYYMALAFVSNCFMIPFFFVLAFADQSAPGNGAQTLTLSMVGSVAACVSGLMTGGLYLFLKSNTLSTIGPKNKAGEYERQRMKHTIRRAASGDPNYTNHMMQPVAAPGNLRRMDSESSLISKEKEDEAALNASRSPTASSRYDSEQPNPLRSNAVYPSTTIPRAPEPAQISSGIGHMRKRSYSLFPNNGPSTKSSVTLLPSTTYLPNANPRTRDAQAALDALKPPPSMRNLAMGRHRRDSSMISSATVQIGLRLSSVDDMPMPPSIPNRTNTPDSDVLSLDCPKERAKLHGKRPIPLNTTPTAAVVNAEAAPPASSSSPKRDPIKDARMKTLPPVPRPGEAVPDVADDDDESRYEEEETLSPTVYNPSPTKRVPSPKGVGFTLPQTRFNGGSPRSPPGKAPPRRGTGDAPAQPATTKDWI
ncbi:RBR-type E3 ubiquitin transferase [Coniochaeta hoffmannii]|uniref:RBR-type E3 ubiquitin transferase n=1 Tax=Coniochaeta hoffmannii TaxID=91930 RepID=A0AA38RKK1_9PEZI|nr:RBR-type E3 ubiquitin transferase [Coniochaeta hoffmannii]